MKGRTGDKHVGGGATGPTAPKGAARLVLRLSVTFCPEMKRDRHEHRSHSEDRIFSVPLVQIPLPGYMTGSHTPQQGAMGGFHARKRVNPVTNGPHASEQVPDPSRNRMRARVLHIARFAGRARADACLACGFQTSLLPARAMNWIIPTR